jgi:hypothetical protein
MVPYHSYATAPAISIDAVPEFFHNENSAMLLFPFYQADE